MTPSIPAMTHLLDFLDRLKAAHIYYTLSNPTDRRILVTAVVPGEYWEFEFAEDGDVQVEVFRSRAGVEGPESIDEFFRRFP